MAEVTSEIESDLIWGGDGIAKEIDRTARQTFHMLETGAIPARKVGNRWVASRSALRKFFRGEVA